MSLTIKATLRRWPRSSSKELDAKAKAEQKELKYQYDNNITDGWSSPSKPKLNDGRRALVKRYKEQYHLGDTAGLSDMLEAATGGNFKIAYGHGKPYWKKHRVYKTPLQANNEAFAEMAEAFIEENKREIFKKELPQSYALYIKMLKVIVERLGFMYERSVQRIYRHVRAGAACNVPERFISRRRRRGYR